MNYKHLTAEEQRDLEETRALFQERLAAMSLQERTLRKSIKAFNEMLCSNANGEKELHAGSRR